MGVPQTTKNILSLPGNPKLQSDPVPDHEESAQRVGTEAPDMKKGSLTSQALLQGHINR